MAFNPNEFPGWSQMVTRRVNKREALLSKHGYYESTIRDGVRSLTPTQERYIELANVSPSASKEEITTMYVYGRHEFDIFSEKNETFKDWMLRLGWLVKTADGHIVEA